MRPLATAATQLGSAHVGECRRGSRVRGGAGWREAGGSVQRVARTLCKCKCCLAVYAALCTWTWLVGSQSWRGSFAACKLADCSSAANESNVARKTMLRRGGGVAVGGSRSCRVINDRCKVVASYCFDWVRDMRMHHTPPLSTHTHTHIHTHTCTWLRSSSDYGWPHGWQL